MYVREKVIRAHVYRVESDDVEAIKREIELSITTRSLEHTEDIDLVTSYLKGDNRRLVLLRATYNNVAEVKLFVTLGLCSSFTAVMRIGETIRHFSHNLDFWQGQFQLPQVMLLRTLRTQERPVRRRSITLLLNIYSTVINTLLHSSTWPSLIANKLSVSICNCFWL